MVNFGQGIAVWVVDTLFLQLMKLFNSTNKSIEPTLGTKIENDSK